MLDDVHRRHALDRSPRARTGTLAERGGGVLAVIVVHEGVDWLGDALDALLDQTYRDLEVLAVDNASTDGSRDVILDRLGVERVLVTDGDVGFAGAVSMALDSAAAAACSAEWLLLVHDDLVLDPDAVARLVAHASNDPRLAAVGPKLLHHDDPKLLQQVGMSIDVTGRASSGLEADELDQGQHDHVRPVLYVSSAGMLVRRSIFEAIGGFDRRYHVFRDDLDLCWRLWLAGYDVEAVPEAVGRHVRAATHDRRQSHVRESGRHYHTERNTLATMLKCYGGARLALVVPLYLAVGSVRLVAYMVTRRFGEAWQIVRAWGWNLRHAQETWRLRAPVQAARVRDDRELIPLFSRLAPQLRTYVEALADRLSGGELEVPAPHEVEDGERSWLRFVALHPVFAVVSVLVV
ncbi:MAG: glycosyltransferase family 2 protein, partial [Actinomycetota bacterium]|nr:glycosyltransferase family 2 protein [Actinomycetota bacterium]